MKLVKALRHGSYLGAVSCILYPRPAIAHVIRQGGYGVHEWWIADIGSIYCANGIAYLMPPREGSTMSFSTVDGCLKWLKKHKVDIGQGWYPTRNTQRWYELGSHN